MSTDMIPAPIPAPALELANASLNFSGVLTGRTNQGSMIVVLQNFSILAVLLPGLGSMGLGSTIQAVIVDSRIIVQRQALADTCYNFLAIALARIPTVGLFSYHQHPSERGPKDPLVSHFFFPLYPGAGTNYSGLSYNMVSSINPNTFLVESNGNLGAVEVTTFLSLVLYGVSLSQGYTYFQQSARDDRLTLRLFVSIVLILETCHSFTAAMAIYYDTVTRWKTAEANSYPIATNILIETLITLLVQCFFSYRIYRLSQRTSISMLCTFLAVLRFVGGTATCVEDFLDVPDTPTNGIGYVVRFSWLITSTFAVGVACDILIAAFMTYYLRKLASPWNFESTTNLLNSLIRWSLQTGIVTSLTSIAVISCFQSMPNMIWFSLYILLAKVYSNSLLVSLNARSRFNGSQDGTVKSVTNVLRFESVQRPGMPIYFQAFRSAGSYDYDNRESSEENKTEEV